MTPLERVEAAAHAVKVFPLPSVVLFPQVGLPLHIFEPRYRDLVADALASDRVIALGQLEPGWESEYLGRPAVKPICCAGVVVWHEELPDGKFNLLVQGTARLRVVEELAPTHAYREFRTEVLPEPAYEGPEEELVRQAVLRLAARLPDEAAERLVQMVARTQGGALADVIAATVAPDVDRRQALLSELDPRRRLTEVLDDLGTLMTRLPPANPGGPLN